MMLKIPAPTTESSLDLRPSCTCRNKTLPYIGLFNRCFRAPALLRYGQYNLNDVSSTRCHSQKEEGSASLLATQNRLPHQTSDSGAPSTSSESRPDSMVGTLRSHSNNAVSRTPPKAPRVFPIFYHAQHYTFTIEVFVLCSAHPHDPRHAHDPKLFP